MSDADPGERATPQAPENKTAATPAPPERSPAGKSRFSDLGVRILSALVLMGLALFALWKGGLAFLLLWLGASLAIFYEWQVLIGGARRMPRIGIGWLALLAIAVCLWFGHPAWGFVLLFVGAGFLALIAEPGRRLWSAGGLPYAGLMLIAVQGLGSGLGSGDLCATLVVAWLFITIWGTDIAAYFAGRLIGGPRLWPRVSPGKTWSGLLVGVLCGGIFGTLLLVAALPQPCISPPGLTPIFLLGLLTALISQGGDLFESWVKRRFGVKDSSRLIPGHGGFMDRLDGFITASIFVWLVGASRGLSSLPEGVFFWS